MSPRWIGALALAAAPALAGEPSVRRSAEQIGATAISAHVRFLADDLLEGRYTGSRGEQLADRYVEAQFAAAGVAPIGSGYLDRVRIVRAAVEKGAGLGFVAPGGRDAALAALTDFVPIADGRTRDVALQAPAVFVGYGIVAPDLHHDDLGDADLRGKVAVLWSDAPSSFPNTARALHSGMAAKLKRLRDRGAVGVLLVYRNERAKVVPWPTVVDGTSKETLFWRDRDSLPDSPDGVMLRALITEDALDRMAAAGGVTKDALQRGAPVPLGVQIRGRWRQSIGELEAANVVGAVRGSDAKLAKEYVVYTAHVDHLGVAPDGKIFHGAVDNASGVAVLLEVARAFARAPGRRSALFVVTTGEEKGFLGAAHFVAGGPIARDAMIANLNIDEAPGLVELHDVVALGVEATTLETAARATAGALGLRLSPDPEPEQQYLMRGDNKRFAKAGIPALRIEPGDGDGKGDLTAGVAAHKRWVKEHYHQAADEWSFVGDYESVARFARWAFLLGHEIADAPARPGWKSGQPPLP
jgi:hypothetical protein